LKKSEIDIRTRISHFARLTVWFRRYRTVRLGAHAKLRNLHSRIGRRVDLARVKYGTTCMQSERRRPASQAARFSAIFGDLNGAPPSKYLCEAAP
jgi:hypothetical protein